MAGSPTDVAFDELTRAMRDMIRRGNARLAAQIEQGLRRGLDPDRVGTDQQQVGDASQRYREQQRRAAQQTVAQMRRQVPGAGAGVTARAWKAGAIAVDQVAPHMSGRFQNINVGAIEAVSRNTAKALDAALATVGQNVDDVFARAAMLTGPITPGDFDKLRFIGRRHDDVWRRYALEHVGQGIATGEARRAISREMARRLIADGVSDALTGFVDVGGRRWPLDTYTQMVIRTTTREAMTRATIDRMRQNGQDIVEITSHANPCEVCAQYDGQRYSLDGKTPGLDLLDAYPPFHPNCRHVLTVGASSLDDFENALADTLGDSPEVQDLKLQLRSHGGRPAPPQRPRLKPKPKPKATPKPKPAPKPKTASGPRRPGAKPGDFTEDELIRHYRTMHGRDPSPAQLAKLRKQRGVPEPTTKAAPKPAPKPKAASSSRPMQRKTIGDPGARPGSGIQVEKIVSRSPQMRGIEAGVKQIQKTANPDVLVRFNGAKLVGGRRMNPSYLGAHSYRFGDRVGVISLRSTLSDVQARTTAVHEISHAIDHQLFNVPGVFGTDAGLDGPLGEFLRLARDTAATKRIEESYRRWNPKFADYLLEDRELWARACQQYFATRAGDREVLELLRESVGKGRFWTDEEFRPFLPIMDKVFGVTK